MNELATLARPIANAGIIVSESANNLSRRRVAINDYPDPLPAGMVMAKFASHALGFGGRDLGLYWPCIDCASEEVTDPSILRMAVPFIPNIFEDGTVKDATGKVVRRYGVSLSGRQFAGIDVACAILLHDVDSRIDTHATMVQGVLRFMGSIQLTPCVVAASALRWHPSVNTEEKRGHKYAQLKTAGITVDESK